MVRTVSLLVVVVVAVAAAVIAFTLPGGPAGAPAETPSPTPRAQRLLVLGDSIGTGAGATTSYAAELVERLGRPLDLRNLARNGWTTSDLLTALQEDPRFRGAVAEADLITVTIGGNDLLAARRAYLDGTCGGADGLDCVRAAVADLGQRWDAIAAELRSLAPEAATIVTATIYDPFAGVSPDAAITQTLDDYLTQANAAIRDRASAHGIAVAPVAESFAGQADLISDDGIHPSDSGHARIADLVSAEITTR